MESYIEGAQRKKIRIAPFIKDFKTTTLEKPYWYILSVRETICLSIAFSGKF